MIMNLIWIVNCVPVVTGFILPAPNELAKQCGAYTCPYWSTCNNNTQTGEIECGFCKQGFVGKNCEDRDECTLLGYDPCARFGTGTCLNHIGGFECACLVGWTGLRCQTIDDNVTASDRACIRGYAKQASNDSHGVCLDIDECINSTYVHKCQQHQHCVNTVGSYICECERGMTGVNCLEDIDECTNTNACGNQLKCINTVGSFSCTHGSDGFGLPEHQHCGTYTCPYWSTCYNNTQTGVIECGACMAGFVGANCTDRDECTFLGYNPCVRFGAGICVNHLGGFHCICAAGWTGPKCQYADENVTASERACVSGYTTQAFNDSYGKCIDIDECSNSTYVHTCQQHQQCVNTVGSYICVCERGMTGVNCLEDINECTNTNACGNQLKCINTVGSYSCTHGPDGLEWVNCTINNTMFSSQTSSLENNPTKERLSLVLFAVFGTTTFLCGFFIATLIYRKQR